MREGEKPLSEVSLATGSAKEGAWAVARSLPTGIRGFDFRANAQACVNASAGCIHCGRLVSPRWKLCKNAEHQLCQPCGEYCWEHKILPPDDKDVHLPQPLSSAAVGVTAAGGQSQRPLLSRRGPPSTQPHTPAAMVMRAPSSAQQGGDGNGDSSSPDDEPSPDAEPQKVRKVLAKVRNGQAAAATAPPARNAKTAVRTGFFNGELASKAQLPSPARQVTRGTKRIPMTPQSPLRQVAANGAARSVKQSPQSPLRRGHRATYSLIR